MDPINPFEIIETLGAMTAQHIADPKLHKERLDGIMALYKYAPKNKLETAEDVNHPNSMGADFGISLSTADISPERKAAIIIFNAFMLAQEKDMFLGLTFLLSGLTCSFGEAPVAERMRQGMIKNPDKDHKKLPNEE